MKNITLQQIVRSCNGVFYGDDFLLAKTVTDIVTDSRKVSHGALFAAIKGQRVDGHDFIERCFEHGAICALCEKKPQNSRNPYILVESVLTALKDIARFYRSLFSIPVIGITGSVGKTSTKEMISSVLSQRFIVHKTQGNFNNELGVPLTVFGLEEKHQIAVIEMGISDFNEMTELAKIVKPTVEVITNIGTCHLENLKDRDGVFKAKTEMFDYLSDDGVVFLNGDDDKLNKVKTVKGKKPLFFGLKSSNPYFAKNIEDLGTDGIKCDLCVKEKTFPVKISAMGKHMAVNAIAAAAIGKYFEMEDSEIIKGIESFQNVGSRSNVIKTGKITIIDDCYNANPVSMKAAIDSLSAVKGRQIAVLGDMKELGENEVQLHLDIGSYINQKKIDFTIAVGPLAKSIADNCTNSIWFENVDKVLNSIGNIINVGDTVLVKASHSMHFEKITEKLKTIDV